MYEKYEKYVNVHENPRSDEKKKYLHTDIYANDGSKPLPDDKDQTLLN